MKVKNILSVLLLSFTAFLFCACFSSNSNSIYGEWVEYRADDPTDTYLISHLEFKNGGIGAFWLTDAGRIRSKFEFTWTDDGYGNITTHSMMDGSSSHFSFNNGLVVENSAFGGVVYKKR